MLSLIFYRRGPGLIANLLNVWRIQRIMAGGADAVSEEFTDAIDDAEEDGIITDAECRRVFLTDTIMKSVRRGSPDPVYAVVECSRNLTMDDIQKIRATANTLSKVFPDAEIHAALYYMNIESFIEEEAKRQGVHLIKAGKLG